MVACSGRLSWPHRHAVGFEPHHMACNLPCYRKHTNIKHGRQSQRAPTKSQVPPFSSLFTNICASSSNLQAHRAYESIPSKPHDQVQMTSTRCGSARQPTAHCSRDRHTPWQKHQSCLALRQVLGSSGQRRLGWAGICLSNLTKTDRHKQTHWRHTLHRCTCGD